MYPYTIINTLSGLLDMYQGLMLTLPSFIPVFLPIILVLALFSWFK